MASGLGGGAGMQLKMTVANGTALTLARGTAVAFHATAGGAAGTPTVIFNDGTINKDYGAGTQQSMDIPIFAVALSPAETTTPGNATVLGIVAADIPAGKVGEIIIYGPARVLLGGTVTTGEVLAADATGRLVDTGVNTGRNPVALSAQAGTVGQLVWAFVNCLCGGGVSAAAFMGRTLV